jgi:hypothetical protein
MHAWWRPATNCGAWGGYWTCMLVTLANVLEGGSREIDGRIQQCEQSV